MIYDCALKGDKLCLEIYDYTAFATNKTPVSSNPYGKILIPSGVSNPIYEDYNKIYNEADFNKNNIFAEKDPDDDGDGEGDDDDDPKKGGKKTPPNEG